MNVLTFLAKNWDSVLVIVAFLAVVVVLIKRGETKILKQILFNLVTQAEKQSMRWDGKYLPQRHCACILGYEADRKSVV